MSAIQLFIDGVELSFVKETLKLKKENNALSSEFSIAHTSYPFLIIENEAALQTLGQRDMTSIGKKKIVNCTVFELGQKYYGQLQILSFTNGFRKCNLKYASDILEVIDDQIANFMPVVSVIPNEEDPVPYTDTSDTELPGSSNWVSYPFQFLDHCFPQAKWQFPTMYWRNKFGVDLEDGDAWFQYGQYINKYIYTLEGNAGSYVENFYTIDEEYNITVFNQNVASPQVFLLSPLYYIAQSIGFKLVGSFVNHQFIRRLLFLSFKDNLCEVLIKPPGEPVTFSGGWLVPNQYEQQFYQANGFKKETTWTPAVAGDYSIALTWDIERHEEDSNGFTQFLFKKKDYYPGEVIVGEYWFHQGSNQSLPFAGSETFDFTVSEDEVGEEITFYFFNYIQEMPNDYSIAVYPTSDGKEYHQMHPTIELGRYVPEWTVGEYLNQLKNTFNLSIDVDDFKKQISVNFNEDIEENEIPHIANKSLYITNLEMIANTSFVLKYGNDEDAALFIARENVEVLDSQTDDFTKEFENQFKMVDHNGSTAKLSEELEDKDGVGLMIYDPAFKPFISKTYQNQNLNIEGEGGLYDQFWKRWLKFRLTASGVEMSGPFTQTELAQINKAKSIYIDHQRYRIVQFEFSEKTPNINTVDFVLESVNY